MSKTHFLINPLFENTTILVLTVLTSNPKLLQYSYNLSKCICNSCGWKEKKRSDEKRKTKPAKKGGIQWYESPNTGPSARSPAGHQTGQSTRANIGRDKKYILIIYTYPASHYTQTQKQNIKKIISFK
jgi:hypothetical protein